MWTFSSGGCAVVFSRFQVGIGLLALVLGISSPTFGATFSGAIVSVDIEFANVNTDISTDAVAEIALGSTVTFRHDRETYTATYVDDFAAVDRGEWVIVTSGTVLTIAISFGNACDVLECAIGDAVEIVTP